MDASFSGAWFLKDESSSQAETALELFLKASLVLWVPSLWFYETANLLINAHARSRIQESVLEEALDLMNILELKTDEPDVIGCRRICQFARQFNLSAYDAAYLELSDRLQLPLLTFDQKLTKACQARHLKTRL